MESVEPQSDREAALVPLEQRHVEIEGEDVLAAWTGQRDVYVPLTPICEALGVAPGAQVRRIRRDDVLAEQLRLLRIDTPGGPQTVQALNLEAVPMWLATLDTARVKEEVRPRLRAFKMWVRQKIWEAFAAEMGWSQATGATPTATDPSRLSLEQVAELGRALTTLAEQQIAFQREQAQAMIEIRGTLSDHEQRLTVQEERMDKAAQVMGATIREVQTLKKRLDPGATITDEQAAELSNRIKAIAEELTRQAAGTPHQKNYYASLFGELHRRFRVSSYKNLTLEKYEQAMRWLRDYDEALGQAINDPMEGLQ
jgi:P22_AR N-terminal domain/ORF6C domain